MVNKRKLIAALACRCSGQRLYGKPLQNLELGYTIIDHLISGLKASEEIDDIVLGIADGDHNRSFISVAEKHDIPYIFGSEKDALWRLILCGQKARATDVFRITTECPFAAWELLPSVWDAHVRNNNDITVTEYFSEGMNFEIYKLSALLYSHNHGNDEERSEYCSQ